MWYQLRFSCLNKDLFSSKKDQFKRMSYQLFLSRLKEDWFKYKTTIRGQVYQAYTGCSHLHTKSKQNSFNGELTIWRRKNSNYEKLNKTENKQNNNKKTQQQQNKKQKNTTVTKLMSCNLAAGDLNKYKRERERRGRERKGDRQTE